MLPSWASPVTNLAVPGGGRPTLLAARPVGLRLRAFPFCVCGCARAPRTCRQRQCWHRAAGRASHAGCLPARRRAALPTAPWKPPPPTLRRSTLTSGSLPRLPHARSYWLAAGTLESSSSVGKLAPIVGNWLVTPPTTCCDGKQDALPLNSGTRYIAGAGGRLPRAPEGRHCLFSISEARPPGPGESGRLGPTAAARWPAAWAQGHTQVGWQAGRQFVRQRAASTLSHWQRGA